MHSPFVFDLYTKVIRADVEFTGVDSLKYLRAELLADLTPVSTPSPGAGSRHKTPARTISSIARVSGSSEKYSRLLFRLVNYFKPEHILELGTSLGIATLYMSSATDETVISLEGNPELVSLAEKNVTKMKAGNVRIVPGLFDDTLPLVLEQLPRLDFVFLDGDHRRDAVIRYVKQMLPEFRNDSVLIIDDIHWSEGMEQAWETIRNFPEVTVTIDLFKMGLVFFRREQVPEHFILRY